MRSLVLPLCFGVTLMLCPEGASAEAKRRVGPSGERAPAAAGRSLQCGPVNPRTLYQVCDRYTTQQGYVECLQAGQDAELDPCGLGFCDTYKTQNGCTACIRAIRDRAYTADDIRACNTVTNEALATECMESVGTSGSSSTCEAQIERTRDGLFAAIQLLNDGDIDQAREILEELLFDLL